MLCRGCTQILEIHSGISDPGTEFITHSNLHRIPKCVCSISRLTEESLKEYLYLLCSLEQVLCVLKCVVNMKVAWKTPHLHLADAHSQRGIIAL